jgi:hypothetical protein
MPRSDAVTAKLHQLVDDLHKANPSAPLFGPLSPGIVQAPVAQWKRYLSDMVQNLLQAPVLGDGCCWKSKHNQIKPYLPGGAGKQPRSVQYVRLIAYLRSPTMENWNKLKDGDIKDPFSHFCNQGGLDEQKRYCVNGLEHGEFTDRKTNEDRKKCHYGSRCLCKHVPKCIFNDKITGRPIPCLMNETHVPQCEHDPRCY